MPMRVCHKKNQGFRSFFFNNQQFESITQNNPQSVSSSAESSILYLTSFCNWNFRIVIQISRLTNYPSIQPANYRSLCHKYSGQIYLPKETLSKNIQISHDNRTPSSPCRSSSLSLWVGFANQQEVPELPFLFRYLRCGRPSIRILSLLQDISCPVLGILYAIQRMTGTSPRNEED